MLAISEGEFEIQMGRLRAVFGQKTYENKVRIEMIWNTVQDIEYKTFCRIVDQMIASMRKPPLPIDFADAVRGEKRIFAVKPSEMELCGVCNGVEVLQATHDLCQTPTLVHCACHVKWHKKTWFAFPVATEAMEAIGWKFTALDWREFKVERFDGGQTFTEVKSKLSRKVEWWRAKLDIAELYWAHAGFKRP